MSSYKRTKFSQISANGFRSLVDFKLKDIPEIVVLYGPNGAGKSNILCVPMLLLDWVGNLNRIPTSQEPRVFEYLDAWKILGIRPSDFARADNRMPSMTLATNLELGDRIESSVGDKNLGGTLVLSATVEDTGSAIRVWFDKASTETIDFLSPKGKGVKLKIEKLETEKRKKMAALSQSQAQLEQYKSNPSLQLQTPMLEETIRSQQKQIDDLKEEISASQKNLPPEKLRAERFRNLLRNKKIANYVEAYRVIDNEEIHAPPEMSETGGRHNAGLQKKLFEASTSDDKNRRDGFRELNALIQSERIFNDSDAVLSPIQNKMFGEYQILIEFSDGRAVPLSLQGTGHQQLLSVISEFHVSKCPVFMVEEPEAHLHKLMMDKLSKYIKSVVEKNKDPGANAVVDQIWIATHSNHFNIMDPFLDVKLTENGVTEALWEQRPKAVKHFYEPSPLWNVLRNLAKNALPGNAVIFHDDHGRAVTAKEVLDSIDEDGELAKEYVNIATQALVTALEKETQKNK